MGIFWLLNLSQSCYNFRNSNTEGRWKRGEKMSENSYPECKDCGKGSLLPLSDFGSQGAPIHYKAWVCSDPDCGFNIKIRNGDVYLNEPIASGASHSPRMR